MGRNVRRPGCLLDMKYHDFYFDLSVHFEQLEISLNIMRKFCITRCCVQDKLHCTFMRSLIIVTRRVIKLWDLEGRVTWAVVSKCSEYSTKGQRPSKSRSFHWMRLSNYFRRQLGQCVYTQRQDGCVQRPEAFQLPQYSLDDSVQLQLRQPGFHVATDGKAVIVVAYVNSLRTQQNPRYVVCIMFLINQIS